MKKSNLFLISMFLTVNLLVFSVPFLNAEVDFVLEGNEIFQITNEEFSWKGNVFLKDNSTLIVDNGTFRFMEESSREYQIALYNNSRLILRNNSTLEYHGHFTNNPAPISIIGNSYFEVSDSIIRFGIASGGNSELKIRNSELRGFGVNGFTKAVVENSSMQDFGCGDKANVTISDSDIRNLIAVGSSKSRILNCSIAGYKPTSRGARVLFVDEEASVWVINCTLGSNSDNDEMKFDGPSTTWLINCDLGSGDLLVQGFEAKVFIAHYLSVDVVSEKGIPIKEALVSIYFAHNNTLAKQATTDLEGNVRFVLPQWIVQELGSIYTGDYKIITTLDTVQNETNITLDSSKQITISQFSSVVPDNATVPDDDVPDDDFPGDDVPDGADVSDDAVVPDDVFPLSKLEIILILIVISLLASIIVLLIYLLKRGNK